MDNKELVKKLKGRVKNKLFKGLVKYDYLYLGDIIIIMKSIYENIVTLNELKNILDSTKDRKDIINYIIQMKALKNNTL